MAAKQRHIGFLMILMQRLVTSSTAAIRTTLEKRQALLDAPQPQASLFDATEMDEWAELDGQSQVDIAVQSRSRLGAGEGRSRPAAGPGARNRSRKAPTPRPRPCWS